MNIKFFKPYTTGKELEYIQDVITNNQTIAGDGGYTKKVHQFLEKKYGTPKALLTTSCTMALEFAVRLLQCEPGDEIIAPSYTFSSTVNAILLAQGLKVVFADIDPRTMNIDPVDVEKKITSRTRAIIVVHYAGVACDMDAIMALAKKNHLQVIEDAAQGIEAKYKGKYLGTIGDFGCISFHETKNIVCGEGGALFINTTDETIAEKAEIMREKGTNRTKFLRGVVDKYTWVDIGSSYLPSDILAAYLYAQLEAADEITAKRLHVYNYYKQHLQSYADMGIVKFPFIPDYAHHNAHIFYLLFRSESDRNAVMDYLKSKGIQAVFHYIPLHSAPQGQRLGYKSEDLPKTEQYAHCLLRLPLYPSMTQEEMDYVIGATKEALDSLK